MKITPIGEYVLIKKLEVQASNGTSLVILNTGDEIYEVVNPGDFPKHHAGQKVLIDDRAYKIRAGNGEFLIKKDDIVAVYQDEHTHRVPLDYKPYKKVNEF